MPYTSAIVKLNPTTILCILKYYFIAFWLNALLSFILSSQQLHSEYRSTYRWHEFTGNSRPEVVRRAPAPNPSQFVGKLRRHLSCAHCHGLFIDPALIRLSIGFCASAGATNEPPLPRRKKCPELAYKSHEFIIGSEYTDGRRDASAHRLARVSVVSRISNFPPSYWAAVASIKYRKLL